MNKAGLLFIISAPSGAGKTSLVNDVVRECDNVVLSISHTTRQPRINEQHEREYYFVDKARFEQMIAERCFIEYAEVYGNYYGTTQNWVDNNLDQGHHVVLEIDPQGAEQIKTQHEKAISIFILPPMYELLKQRLLNRQTDDMATISKRLLSAEQEIGYALQYDFIIINDDYKVAINELKAIITAMTVRSQHQLKYYQHFVKKITEESK